MFGQTQNHSVLKIIVAILLFIPIFISPFTTSLFLLLLGTQSIFNAYKWKQQDPRYFSIGLSLGLFIIYMTLLTLIKDYLIH
ncbi:hypothetical protein [Psychrobacillus sp. NPDC096389]|uniref:hypothetical protein n=1 Tax=Psychrobacillus sp. NPDC096389 TaxID=3364490 RepID=UPI003806ED8A